MQMKYTMKYAIANTVYSRLIGSAHCSLSRWLVRLNGLDQRKPLRAESGEGCGHTIVWLRGHWINERFDCASFHRKINTTGWSALASALITLSVIYSRHHQRWDHASDSLTVKTVLSKTTHCLARELRIWASGIVSVSGYSLHNSLKIFFNDGGCGTHWGTANASPFACQGWWYGSCHKITTLLFAGGVASSAAKTLSQAG